MDLQVHKLAPLLAAQQCPLVGNDPATADGADTGKSLGTLGNLTVVLGLAKVVGTSAPALSFMVAKAVRGWLSDHSGSKEK